MKRLFIVLANLYGVSLAAFPLPNFPASYMVFVNADYIAIDSLNSQ